MWDNQTGATNRFLMRRVDWSSMSHAHTGLLAAVCQRLQDVLFGLFGPRVIWAAGWFLPAVTHPVVVWEVVVNTDYIQACRSLGVLRSRCTSQRTAELRG